jgi:hypothetical protein
VTTAIGQGDYNLTLAAVAIANDMLVFAGTVDLYRCALRWLRDTSQHNQCAERM